MKMSETIILNGKDLTLEQVIEVSRGGVKIELSSEAVEAVNASRKIIDDIVESKRTVYGVNTGFGSLVKVSIPQEETRQLQENLIRTHSSGFGDPLKEDEVRAIMLIRVNSLLKGYSGIRLSTIETLSSASYS
jgi:histidine ammonia-lyase